MQPQYLLGALGIHSFCDVSTALAASIPSATPNSSLSLPPEEGGGIEAKPTGLSPPLMLTKSCERD